MAGGEIECWEALQQRGQENGRAVRRVVTGMLKKKKKKNIERLEEERESVESQVSKVEI